MDLHSKTEEQLDNLPSRERFPDNSRDRYRRWNFPYRRMLRWLESRVGKHIDSVTHEYVNADWIPQVFRQAHHLAKYVETNTFMLDGKVCFYDSYCSFSHLTHKPYRLVEQEGVQTIYVHPVTRLICLYRPPTKESYQKARQRELDAKVRILNDYYQITKIEGIWYFIKGEPQPKYCLGWGLQRKASNEALLEINSEWTNKNSKHPFVKIIHKKQLSNKELKKHGLKNDYVLYYTVGKKVGKFN